MKNEDVKLTLPNNWYALHLPTTTSTMLRLREADLMERSEEFVLLTTDFQTAGHGQQNSVWESDAGKNLLFGFLMHPHNIPPDRQFSISEALSLAVADALDTYAEGMNVKWPNDVYWHDRKICGMLIEHDLQGSHIATTLTGVGVNVNQQSFFSGAPNPVSLCQIIDRETDRTALLSDILRNFEAHYRALCQGEYAELHAQYRNKLYHGTGFHLFADLEGKFEAEITDISSIGHLFLRRRDGRVKEYAFKEVAFVTNSKE